MRRVAIIQGEHVAVAEPDTVVTTLLGSCIAMCLHDPVARVGGMNHFLLGEPEKGGLVPTRDLSRYGVHAMELLINALMKIGAVRSRLRAHIYGGATIIAGLGGIGTSNAQFARRFVEMEGMVLGHVDTGGTLARRVEFMPVEGRARCVAVPGAPDLPIPQRGFVTFRPRAASAPAPAPVAAGDVELF